MERLVNDEYAVYTRSFGGGSTDIGGKRHNN